MANKIEEGDDVRHITPAINGGLQMTVLEIDEDELNAKCSHFVSDNGDVVHKETWFPISDLILIRKASGGFIQ